MLLVIDRMQMTYYIFCYILKRGLTAKSFHNLVNMENKNTLQSYFEVYPIADLFRVIFHSCCFILFCLRIVKSNTHGLICLRKLERKTRFNDMPKLDLKKGVCV